MLVNNLVPAHEGKDTFLILIQVGGLDLCKKLAHVLRLGRNDLVSFGVEFDLQFVDLLQVDFVVGHVNFGHDLAVGVAQFGEYLC